MPTLQTDGATVAYSDTGAPTGNPNAPTIVFLTGGRLAVLAALSADIRHELAAIPAANRDMLVFHNAWLYYSKRFGLRTLGVIEEVPGSEPSAAHLAQLVDLARAAHVRAIFAEPEYNANLVRAVARSAGIPPQFRARNVSRRLLAVARCRKPAASRAPHR